MIYGGFTPLEMRLQFTRELLCWIQPGLVKDMEAVTEAH